MNLLHALLLGIVEGVTEFLPISSTAHLLLAQELLDLPPTAFLKSFDIIIQFGAIGAVVVIYGKKLWSDWQLVQKVVAAFIPTGILGLLLAKHVEAYQENVTLILFALVVGGWVLVIFELWHGERDNARQSVEQISYTEAVLIGFFQAFAFVPGVSRSAATVLGGLGLGIGRKAMVEFSFLLAIPTMGAATLYKAYKNAGSFDGDQWAFLLVGFVTSFVVAWLAVQFLLRFVRTHTFAPFGIYRILAAGAFAWLWLAMRG